MSRLALYLLGSPCIELDGEPIHVGRSKAVALLAYLAIEGRRHSRDALATLLWPEYSQREARAQLRRSLSVLNRTLGKEWFDTDRVSAGLRQARSANHHGELVEPSGHTLWLDVNAFRQQLAACEMHGHPVQEACPDCLALLTEAVELYRDDFLSGFTLPDSPAFDDWQRYQTQDLQDELDSALERLADGRSAAGASEPAIAAARRRLELDPLRESAHRQLMRLYSQAGRRTAALRQYRACVRVLEQELAIPPSAETTALYEQIRADEEVLQVQRTGQDATPRHNLPLQLSSFIGRQREIGEVTELLDKHRLVTLTGTVTFLFTDIEGSTPLWEREPEKMATALQIHNAAMRPAIEAHGGLVFKTVGDEVQAAFSTAPQALKAAIEGQRALQSAPWNELGPLKVRMGLHTGEAKLDPGGDEYAVSHAKNRVARIMSAAHGGQILLSDETGALCDHQLPPGVSLKDLGEHGLKGMAILERLFQVCTPDLPQDFPPLATTITHPQNLPLQLSSFIGREREIGEVTALLEKHRLVTLTGSGGTGKTRLSLRVAEEALEGFPNGVWFAELAGLGDPELVPRTIVAALGLQESPNRSLLDQLKDYAREKQLLIVLDNCEHVIADCARIADALLRACPKLKIMASSREALSVAGEIAYHVPSLSVPDPRELPPLEAFSHFAAMQLFAERATAVNPGFAVTADNAQAVAQVCRRLDGIPLAIELAAARVGALSVEQIAARLDNRFRLLTGGSRTAVPRQQTLRASIDWSYSLLDASERLLLMRLSVFQGGWTLELAGEVCGFDVLDEFDVLDGLTQLVNKSLVHTVSGADGLNRYRRLETIRQYAREKLFDSGASEAVHDRHLDAYLHLVEKAEPHLRGHGQVEWLDRLEVELDNLRAALEWALEGDALKGLRLATSLYWLWHIRGYRVEGEHWLRKMQERLGEHPALPAPADDPALLAKARARQAMLQLAIGWSGSQVMPTAEEALALAEGLGDAGKPIQCMALHAMAWTVGYLGQTATLHRLNRRCLEMAEELDDRFLIAESLQGLAGSEPDPVKAREYAERNLALRRELGDLDGLMTALRVMGNLYYWLGDILQASLAYEKANRTARRVKNRWGLILGISAVGRTLYELGELDQAIEHFVEGLTVAQDLGEQAWVIRGLNALGFAFGLKKDWPKAERYFQQAIDISRTNQTIFLEVTSRISLAEVAWTLGNVELAVGFYQAAADIGKDQDELSLEGLTAYAAGKAALLCGDLRSAGEFFRAALKDYAQKRDLKHMGPSLESLAICAVQAERFERAVRLHGVVASRRWLRDPLWMLWLASYDLDTLLAPARAALDEARYEQLFQEGRAMSLEQAVAYALEVKDDG